MKSSLPDNTRCEIYHRAEWEGGRQAIQKASVLVKTFPTPGPPKKLISSLAWMFAYAYLGWPEFLDNYSKLGFNTVSTHYAYDKHVPVAERVEILEQARGLGMRTMVVGSPFYGIRARREGNSTRPDGSPLDDNLDACPAYRGALYQEDLRKIEERRPGRFVPTS